MSQVTVRTDATAQALSGATTAVPSCAAVARSLGESPAGTASPIRSWLMIEQPGSWGRDVQQRVTAAALSPERRTLLGALWTSRGLRPLVIRKPGRHRG